MIVGLDRMRIHVLPLAVLAALHCYHGALSAVVQNSHHLVRRDLEFLKQLDLKEDNHQIIKRHAADEEPLSRQKRTKRDSAKDRVQDALGDLIAETPLDREKRFKRDVTHAADITKKNENVEDKPSEVESKETQPTKRNKSKKQHPRIKKNKKKRKNEKKHQKKHSLLAKKHTHHNKHNKHNKHSKTHPGSHNDVEKRSKKKAHKKHMKKDKTVKKDKTKKLKKKALKHKHKNDLSKKNAPK